MVQYYVIILTLIYLRNLMPHRIETIPFKEGLGIFFFSIIMLVLIFILNFIGNRGSTLEETVQENLPAYCSKYAHVIDYNMSDWQALKIDKLNQLNPFSESKQKEFFKTLNADEKTHSILTETQLEEILKCSLKISFRKNMIQTFPLYLISADWFESIIGNFQNRT